MSKAQLVQTDSRGIQDKTIILRVPCDSLQENSERPVTVERGTNVLLSPSAGSILGKFNRLYREGREAARARRYLDGDAAKCVATILADEYCLE
jgi:UDP-N-acetylglucosamine 2-epimerase (non-hydrolysing)